MPDRREVLERFERAAIDIWAVAREMPDLGPEQRKAVEAVEDGTAIPRLTIQLGHTLMVGVDVLSRYTEPGATTVMVIKVAPISAMN